MKKMKIITASISLALSLGHADCVMATDNVPIEILDFAAQNGLVLQKNSAPIVHKYALAGKSVVLTGKLSISGTARYRGRKFAFAAPGNKKAIQQITYIFDQPDADGAIPFHLNHPYGNFDGVMTAVGPDKYTLQMNDPQGSMLSALAYYGQQSGNEWKNTLYSYTATATQKKVRGVPTTFLEVKEKAGFRITIPTFTGAVVNYKYSYDWKAAAQ